MKPVRVWILLPSGRQLNVPEPDPWAWTDRALASRGEAAVAAP